MQPWVRFPEATQASLPTISLSHYPLPAAPAYPMAEGLAPPRSFLGGDPKATSLFIRPDSNGGRQCKPWCWSSLLPPHSIDMLFSPTSFRSQQPSEFDSGENLVKFGLPSLGILAICSWILPGPHKWLCLLRILSFTSQFIPAPRLYPASVRIKFQLQVATLRYQFLSSPLVPSSTLLHSSPTQLLNPASQILPQLSSIPHLPFDWLPPSASALLCLLFSGGCPGWTSPRRDKPRQHAPILIWTGENPTSDSKTLAPLGDRPDTLFPTHFSWSQLPF